MSIVLSSILSNNSQLHVQVSNFNETNSGIGPGSFLSSLSSIYLSSESESSGKLIEKQKFQWDRKWNVLHGNLRKKFNIFNQAN